MSLDMTAPVLRPYQAACVDQLRAAYAAGHRAPLLVAPTGAGKTVIFSAITRGAERKGRRALIVAHRRELIRQAAAKLALSGVHHGVIAAGAPSDPSALIQVGSIQTLVGRLNELPPFDLLVLDEAHHARAAGWGALIAAQPRAKLLGVTATPARLDGRGLGIAVGGPFDTIVRGPTTAELIAEGFLCSTRCYVPARQLDLSGVRSRAGDFVASDVEEALARSGITGDAVADYTARAAHQPAIAFCITVAHAEAVAAEFRSAGYRALCVHGDLPSAERDALISGLADGSVEVLTSCDVISEGLDVPAVAAIILLRPTKSVVLHRQQIGRGMRPAEGKGALIVNDHVGNTIRLGLPEIEPEWSLAGVAKPEGMAPVWVCRECGCANSVAARLCGDCGEPKPLPSTAPRDEITTSEGELALLTADRLARVGRMSYREMASSQLSEAELRAFARVKGYHARWVAHRLREQRAASAL